MKKDFRAFTLAEVLITLGIIGVVAAITMPTLIQNYQKHETVTKLKKVYSILSQAYEHSKIENGEYTDWNLTPSSNPKEYVLKYWTPYLKVAKNCDTYSDCGYNKTRPWISLQNDTSAEDVTGTSVRHAIVLADGTVVSFRIPPVDGTAKISIDINGSKKPNKSGRDYFQLEITEEGMLRPFHASGLTDCSSTGYGALCFDKIVQDGWQIKDDYPW